MYYNQTHNQLTILYIKKQILLRGLENKRDTNTEWGKTEFKEKKEKGTNLKKTKSTIRNMCGLL